MKERLKPTKKEQRFIDKRLSRYLAFVSRFGVGIYIHVHTVRELIAGMIEDREKHPAFTIHHKINFGGCVRAHLNTNNNI